MEEHGPAAPTPKSKCRCHLNSVGSLGYCLAGLGVSSYVIALETRHLVHKLDLLWPTGRWPGPDLLLSIGLLTSAGGLLPLFFCCAVFRSGNFANDGYRLGIHDGACSKEFPPLPGRMGFLKKLWAHGGPTGPLVHLVIAHLLLLMRTVTVTSMIQKELLPKDLVWSTELALVLPQHQRIAFMDHLDLSPSTSAPFNSTANPIAAFGFGASSERGFHTHWHLPELGDVPWGPFSPHFVNFLLASLIYAGKYASVFWDSNKGLGLTLLVQMMASVAQSVLLIIGFQVMYKIKLVGETERILPVEGNFMTTHGQSIALYIGLQIFVLATHSVVYLYGFSKFDKFLNTEKEKYQILNKHGHKAMWPYCSHVLSLLVLVLMTGAASPLIYDWTVVYKASLDSASLVASCGTVVYLFLWILFWMILTIKGSWAFKLRVRVSKTGVRNTHSVRLVNEVHLTQQAEDSGGPLMVIGAGKTYILRETAPKAVIMKLVKSTLADKKAAGEEEEIYWLRPKLRGEVKCWKRNGDATRREAARNGPFEAAASEASSDNLHLDTPSDESGEEACSNDPAETPPSRAFHSALRNFSFVGPQSGRREAERNSSQEPGLGEVAVGSEFPAPPPELALPSDFPVPPDTPPPPLPPDDESRGRVGNSKAKMKNPLINAVIEDDQSVGGNGDGNDSTSLSSSLATSEKRSDSGIHSQASTGTHSKCGSSGSESCVPFTQEGYQRQAQESPDNGYPASPMHRCSSVDKLCSLPPSTGPMNPKSYSLHPDKKIYSSKIQANYNQYAHHNGHADPKYNHNNNNTLGLVKNGIIENEYGNLYDSRDKHAQKDISRNGHPDIKLVGGGYGFLPPSKYERPEPVYSDASTPVVIRRRSSISAMEPETPPYERSSSSFSTFTEPIFNRASFRSSASPNISSVPGKAMTVGGHSNRNPRPTPDSKHATIASGVLPKGFHQPGHADPRYFSVTANKNQGVRIHPSPETNNYIPSS